MMYKYIEVVQKEAVYYIYLNRPKAYNSIHHGLALELIAALEEARDDPSVRALVLTGKGKGFCAGQDLKEAAGGLGKVDHKKIIFEGYNIIVKLLREIEKPIIAGVRGIAAGAGASIALACDVIVAAEGASFIQAFSKIGLIPDTGGTYFLPRLIGFQKALALTLLAEPLSAREAERQGMIYKVVATEKLEEWVEKLAIKLSKMPTKALGKTKVLYNETYDNPLAKQLDREGREQLKLITSHDAREGVRAFIEKRTPKFIGK